MNKQIIKFSFTKYFLLCHSLFIIMDYIKTIIFFITLLNKKRAALHKLSCSFFIVISVVVTILIRMQKKDWDDKY